METINPPVPITDTEHCRWLPMTTWVMTPLLVAMNASGEQSRYFVNN
jgi:hypothetical protein